MSLAYLPSVHRPSCQAGSQEWGKPFWLLAIDQEEESSSRHAVFQWCFMNSLLLELLWLSWVKPVIVTSHSPLITIPCPREVKLRAQSCLAFQHWCSCAKEHEMLPVVLVGSHGDQLLWLEFPQQNRAFLFALHVGMAHTSVFFYTGNSNPVQEGSSAQIHVLSGGLKWCSKNNWGTYNLSWTNSTGHRV